MLPIAASSGDDAPMRFLAVLAVSLITAVAVFVAGFALLHGLRTPPREKSSDTRAIVIPQGLESRIEAIDRQERRVRFSAADASARVRHILEGRCEIPDAARIILRSLAASARVLTETEIDPDGKFRFEAMPAGTYEIRVLDARGKPLERLDRVELFADRSMEIARPNRVRVRVQVYRDGEAVAKAYLIFSRGRERLASGSTDESGTLELDALTPGPLEWRAWILDTRQDPVKAKTVEWRGSSVLAPTESALRIDLPQS